MNGRENPFNDRWHMSILGKTQTGKTTTVREAAHENERVVVMLNEPGVDHIDGFDGKGWRTVRSVEQLEEGFRANVWKYDFISGDRAGDLAAVRRWMWRKAERADRELPMMIVVDEFHRLAPENARKSKIPGRDELRAVVKEGAKRNVKLMAATQDPRSADKQIISQCEYRLIFDMASEDRESLSRYSFDWEAVDATDRHTGTLFDDKGRIVPGFDAVKAQEKYA